MLVGVDDDVGIGPLCGRQVVVGHQHLQAQRFGMRHAFHAGDAVVHRDQHFGALGFDAVGNRSRQAIAVHHAVGYQIADVLRAQQFQATQGQRAGGGAVAVVIGHDAQALALGDGVSQQGGRCGYAQEPVGRQEFGQAVVNLRGTGNAACCVQARQQRMHAGLL